MGTESERVMRCREVVACTGLSRVTIWRLERAGKFPRRCQLSANAVGWLSSEIFQWLATRCRR